MKYDRIPSCLPNVHFAFGFEARINLDDNSDMMMIGDDLDKKEQIHRVSDLAL